jgi:hypothetical protein
MPAQRPPQRSLWPRRPDPMLEGEAAGDPTAQNIAIRRQVDGRLLGLRTNRFSWWVHWRELADYLLPRRYKWLVTPNQMARGSPINQHILDSTATLAARNLASGMMSGITNPSSIWFKLKIGRADSTQTSPVSLWLAECERLMMLIFQESNFYNAMAIMYLDLVVFGTAAVLIYEDFEDVIRCFNPCLGEFYLDQSDRFRVDTFYREFTLTIPQVVQQFGYENCSAAVQVLFDTGEAALTREIIVAHAIEPNADGRKFGIPEKFKFREVYWEWGQSNDYVLAKRGFHEIPGLFPRWDLVSNDAYGRSPGMDALPDVKQLQLETRRKAQAIDKLVNPPMVADIQLKNQPASLLPGGVTYISGMTANGRPGFAPVYHVVPPVKEIMEDLSLTQDRIKDIFFNKLFQAATQYEPKSNVTATEWDLRKSEVLVMLGPVLERLYDEGIKPAVERTWAIASRANIFPPAPPEIQGQAMEIEFISMLSTAQQAAQTAGIERMFAVAGQLAGIDPAIVDNIDFDYGFDKMSSLLGNDPRLIRAPQELAAIRQQRQAQQQQDRELEMSRGYAEGAKNLAQAPVGAGKNALQQMIGG